MTQSADLRNDDDPAGRVGKRAVFRRVLYAVGRVVAIAAVGFVGYQVWLQLSQLSEFLRLPFLLSLFVAALAYAGCALLLVVAWHLALMMSGFRLSFYDSVSIYGRSNILKYLPSNVVHMVGRYAMLLGRGVEHRVIVSSTMAEIGLSIVAALSVAIVFGGPVLVENLKVTGFSETEVTIAAVSVVVVLCAVVWIIVSLGSRREFKLLGVGGHRAFAAIFTYLVYFLGLGAVTVLVAVSGGSSIDWRSFLDLTGIVAAAWVVGLVTPGAPAGLGVREAVMIVALSDTALGDEAVLIALGLRVATLGGDVLLWLIGAVLENWRQSKVDDRIATHPNP